MDGELQVCPSAIRCSSSGRILYVSERSHLHEGIARANEELCVVVQADTREEGRNMPLHRPRSPQPPGPTRNPEVIERYLPAVPPYWGTAHGPRDEAERRRRKA
jgi:hypothetical protein